MSRSRFVAVAAMLIFLAPVTVRAEAPFRYTEGKHGKAELKYSNDLPVLVVEGTPEEIGEQVGALTPAAIKRLLSFPKGFLEKFGLATLWPSLVKVSNSMLPQFPEDNRKELDAIVKQAGVERELAIVGNTFPDIKKFGGCSTLIVEPERSSTKELLFGRNLDYPTLGFLHEYTLVTVYRPTGKFAFASVGFPGLLGCLSGMNEKGLALAVLEVYAAGDDSVPFDPKGVPYALCYRRIMEECSTVDEAEKLLRSLKRTTRNNLAVCDTKGGAVFEITPDSLVVRRSEKGCCPCTNHFRCKELSTDVKCRRYRILEKGIESDKLGFQDTWQLLHGCNQGERTFQTMIFEPASLKLHLAIGACPSSALEPKLLELGPLFKKE